MQSILGKRIFKEEESKEGDGTGREENWRRGLTPEEELHSSKGSCYRVYRHVGLGARKPVGFLGPVESMLVNRVDHPNWHQGSDRIRRERGKAT